MNLQAFDRVASGSRRTRVGPWLCLAVAVVAALALRLPGVSDSALVFHPVRQYPGLLFARAQYYALTDQASPSAPAVEASGRSVPQLEPRILESLVALGYAALGEERRGLGGVLSALLWVFGGVLLFLLAQRLASRLAAGVALAFYLFIPYGIIATRGIQPDAAMVILMLGGLLAIVRHHERPGGRSLLLAAGISGMAILVKPFCVFFLVGAFTALAIRRSGPRAGILYREGAAFLVVALLPWGFFYLHATLFGSELGSFANIVVVPSLVFESSFWQGWYRMIEGTVGILFAVAAVLAVVVSRHDAARWFMVGALAGYAVLGLAFTYTIHTHEYYQLPFIPIVGLGVGLTVDAGVAWARRANFGVVTRSLGAAAITALVASIASSAVVSARPVPGEAVRAAVARAQRIGRLVSHSTGTVMLSTAHGWPLRYHAEVAGPAWPYAVELPAPRDASERRRRASERLGSMVSNGAEWFVITEMEELDLQPELRSLLEERARLAEATEHLLLYDLTPSKSS